MFAAHAHNSSVNLTLTRRLWLCLNNVNENAGQHGIIYRMNGPGIERTDYSLPPPDARLINPYTDKFDTPLDERGLVDIATLISAVKATVDSDYEWSSGVSVHHFYWPGSNYPYDSSSATYNKSTFRNLPIHKGLVLREFENWLHLTTLPPPMPDEEIRRHRVESWIVARDLFKMARKTVRWERQTRRRRELIAKNPHIVAEGFNGEDVIGEEIMQEILDKNFRGFERQLHRNERIPAEFRLVRLDTTPDKIARRLGQVVMPRTLLLAKMIAG